MLKQWVWIMAIGLVLAVGASNYATGFAYDLTKLKSVCVEVEDLTDISKYDFGLYNEAIEKHVYVWLKGKLPRLKIERSGACTPSGPYLWVGVSIDIDKMGGKKVGYYGAVSIHVTRQTRWETGRVGRGIAYRHDIILSGPMTGAMTHVSKQLDRLLTDFAAEYYKAGNP